MNITEEARYSWKYSAADILGTSDHAPKYRGGLKAYKQDRKAHRAYHVWHLLVTKGKCRSCAKALG